MSKLQKTIKNTVALEGAGIHTGKKCFLKLLPAPENTGVVFIRVDLPDNPAVKAQFNNLISTNRRTALVSDGVRVETVEHLLASFFVLGIDNCRVEIDTDELPALDGSGLPYYNLIMESGLRELDAPSNKVVVRSLTVVKDDAASIRAQPSSELSVAYRLSYPQMGLEQDFSCVIDPEVFASEIAPARTFVLEEEIERLKAAGFGKGANESNTVVLSSDGPKGELRFKDESVRHKILDLLGDLFFLNAGLQGHLECVRSGHALNRELVKALLKY